MTHEKTRQILMIAESAASRDEREAILKRWGLHPLLPGFVQLDEDSNLLLDNGYFLCTVDTLHAFGRIFKDVAGNDGVLGHVLKWRRRGSFEEFSNRIKLAWKMRPSHGRALRHFPSVRPSTHAALFAFECAHVPEVRKVNFRTCGIPTVPVCSH